MKKNFTFIFLILLQIFHLQSSIHHKIDSKYLPSIIIDVDFKTEKLPSWQKFHKTITNKYTPYGDIVGKLAFHLLSGLLVLKCCSIAHECGHALALKLLFGTSSTLYIPASLTATIHACIHEPVPLGIKSALMYAAGPLSGIAAHYIIAKIEAIINELVNNKKVSCKERIIQAIKKPFYANFIRPNQEFTFGITIATLYGLCLNFSQFIPSIEPLPNHLANEYNRGITYTDGYGILQSLGYYK